MSGRALHRQPDGRLTVGARKTMRRVLDRRAPHDMPDWRVAVLLPEVYCLGAPGAGATAFTGVSVEPDPVSGPLAVATGKGLEWCCQQIALFLLSISQGEERILSAVVTRGADSPSRSQQIVLDGREALFPRGSGKPWRFSR